MTKPAKRLLGIAANRYSASKNKRMRHTFIILVLLFSISANSQNNIDSTIIEIGNKTDTLCIRQFDNQKKLVFEKFFPEKIVEISQILGYSYNDNKLERYIWLHSNVGFLVSVYEYDSVSNVRKTYEYESKGEFKDGLKYIFNIDNFEDIIESPRYIELLKQERKLKAITYFRDTVVIKNIRFESNGDTIIENYEYENNLLKIKIETSISNDYNCSTFYEYDSLGRILSWGKCKIENPYILFKYAYVGNNRIIIEEIEDGKVICTEINEYKDSLLRKEIYYNGKRTKRSSREIIYYYDNYNLLISKTDSNYLNSGMELRIEYVYK
ncbi:MAG: hypothetical protein PHZ02_16840 [Desulfocapsaceae bacterium]|nr:hypothetical protein [Desulfocapsaceae bacterium]